MDCPINYAHEEHTWYEAKANGSVWQWSQGYVPDLPQNAVQNTTEYWCEGVAPKHRRD